MSVSSAEATTTSSGASLTSRKRNRDACDGENVSPGKHSNAGDKISDDVLGNLGTLQRMIESYVKSGFVEIPRGSEIQEYLIKTSSAIPRLVVFGDQSCGKSSLLKALTGHELNISATIGTRCPIVIRCSKKYRENTYSIYTDNTLYASYSSIDEAEKVISSAVGDSLAVNSHIICDIAIETGDDMSIVDLPGYNVDANVDYFNAIRNTYLDKEESIILHVVKADTDPRNVHSRSFLDGVKGKIVKVVTHIDSYETNADKKVYIDLYREESENGVLCLTIPRKIEDEIGTINRQSISRDGDQIGINCVYSSICEKIQERTHERMPAIIANLKCIKTLIGEALDKIQRRPPDMKDCRMEFRRNIQNNLLIGRQDGGWVVTILKAMCRRISEHEFEMMSETNFGTEKIQSMIESGSRINLKGTEGYGSVIDEMMKQLYDVLEPKVLEIIAEEIGEIVAGFKENIPLECPYSNDANIYMVDCVEKTSGEIIVTVQKEVRQLISEKKNNPFCNDTQVYALQEEKRLRKIYKKFHVYYREQRNIATAFESDDVGEGIFQRILDEGLREDPHGYKSKAESAREYLEELWKSECRQIKQNIIQKVQEKIAQMCENVENEIMDINISLFKEVPEIDAARTRLSEIEEVIDTIIEYS